MRVVDSFAQRVQRLRDHREADQHYSGKKAHTVKTQVVVTLGNRDVRRVTLGVPGPVADPMLVRQSGVLARATPDDPLIGDQAYRAVDNVVTPRRKPRGQERLPEDVAFNRAFARARIIVDHSIRDLRQFQALTRPDRHRRGQEPRVCAVVERRARRCRPGRRDRRLAA